MNELLRGREERVSCDAKSDWPARDKYNDAQ